MNLFIHRRDLRTEDLSTFQLLQRLGEPVIPLLILDPMLLEEDRHLEHSGRNFLLHVADLVQQYRKIGGQLQIMYGEPSRILKSILLNHRIEGVYFHQDVTPYALHRDREMALVAEAHSVRTIEMYDHLLIDIPRFHDFCRRSQPYKVFTPFYKQWREYLRLHAPSSSVGTSVREVELALLKPEILSAFPFPEGLLPAEGLPESPDIVVEDFFEERLPVYSRTRDSYASEGTSQISRHLNCGALSIRRIYHTAVEYPEHEAWIRQLAWRDFYYYQAAQDPDFFRYEHIYNLGLLDDLHFEVWSQGRTGIPIIDAAMRQLNETGWMPNRLRMLAAMFLTKQLGCPFPMGEAYFRNKLADYDRTLNRGGWLWSASLGFDAAPYFRIMNPVTQSKRWDPQGAYLRRWLPELADLSDKEIHQPRPDAIVDLAAARTRAISLYRAILYHDKNEVKEE
jgi:deoxyribodipyrimidine photo-lyase